MLVSIVIPVYNRAEMVINTLTSVVKQTHRPIQLVLVDNNSTDDTLSVLQSFKQENESSDFIIEVTSEPSQGASKARNTGANVAIGEWLMFFDSDDTMDECHVAKYVDKIKNESVDVVCTTIDYEYRGKIVRSFLSKDNFLVNHIFHVCLSTERYIMKKSLFEQVGGWNEALSYWDDWELGVRILLEQPKVSVVDDGVFVHVNVHDDSITGSTYSLRYTDAKKALDAVAKSIRKSGHKQRDVLLKYVQYKKVLLAGLYKQEGCSDLSQLMMAEVCTELKGQHILMWFYRIMYRYVCAGGRGSQRIVKYLVR